MPQQQTLDESLAESWKEISAKYATDEEPLNAEAEGGEKPEGEEVHTEPEKPEQPRRADGTFDKPEKAQVEKPPKPQKAEKPQADAGTDEAPERQAKVRALDVNRAPSSWKPTIRAEWKNLPESVRTEIWRREQDFHDGQQQYLPDAQFGRTLRETIAPYRMLIEAEGGTPERAVGDLLRTAAIFRVGTPQQKYQAIAQIAQQFGLDLTIFGRQPAANGQQAQPSGQVLDPRVDQLLAHQRQQESDQRAREQGELEAQVNSWMAQVDEQGEPKYPYLSDVIADMSALVPQIRQAQPHLTTAQILEEGYKRAIWAHPEVRTLLQREAASATAAKAKADNQSKVRDAKRAASVNVPRRASLPNPGKPGRIEDTIADKARELGLIT